MTGPPSASPQYWANDGNLYTSSTLPTFSDAATSADGSTSEVEFKVLSGSTEVEHGYSSYVASGATASWTATTALATGSSYSIEARAYDGTEWGHWSALQAFTVDTDTPASPVISCASYPANTWTAQVTGGSSCSWTESTGHVNGYTISLDGVQSWTTGTSTTVNPGPGLHTLTVRPQTDAGTWGNTVSYVFGVGTSGINSPANGATTATSLPLTATAPSGYTSVSFSYRVGTSASWTAIPPGAVTQNGTALSTWPVSANTVTGGVTSPALTWNVNQTVANDGLIQVEAIFTGNGTVTTPVVSVTLARIGNGTDFGTTQAGPAMVGLQSGNAAVSATDVQIASYGAALAVVRTFNSLDPGHSSVFGPGWVSSLTGGVTSPWSQVTDDGTYAVAAKADGSTSTFATGSTANGITSYAPQGTAVADGPTLTKNTTQNTFTLTDSSGTSTVFTVTNTAQNSIYQPSTVTVQGEASSTGIAYDSTSTDATYGKPLLMVAPDAASTSPPTTACPYPASASTWTAGCRGLSFSYDSASGNVSQLTFDYVTNSGTFHAVAVASYSYDTSGRLAAEWDPRLATLLKTTYTYDETPTDSDYGRITQVSPAQQAGSGALSPWTFTYGDTTGTTSFGKLLSASRTHSSAYGGGTATTTIAYFVPLTTAAGGPLNMDAATAATWGQTDMPASAVAVFPPNHVPASPPTAGDYQYAAEIDYYDAEGREVNTASYVSGTWAVTTTQYDTYGNVVSTLTAANRATALAATDTAGTAAALSTVSLYGCDSAGTVGACTSSNLQYQVLTDTYGPTHVASVAGVSELIRTHTAYSYDSGAPNSDVDPITGGPYMLVTSQTESASVGESIPGTATGDSRTTSHAYANSSTSIGWALGTPLTTVTDPSGLDIVSTKVYNTSATLYGGADLQTGSYMPSDTGGGGAGDTETVYYTAGSNPVVAACGNEPEWANLPCQTGPAAQPGTSGLPPLPVTTYTYDDYLNPSTKTETFGSTGTRITTTSYDAAERPLTQTITVTGTGMGTAVPETRTLYSAASGLVTDTQTLSPSGGVTADINTGYDDFGNVLSYTDASGNTSTFTYDIANRITSRNDGEGIETLSYTNSLGAPTQITDSQAGTFAATYNPDGSLVTETYPGGTTATYNYDATGTAVALQYANSKWTTPLIDSVVPNAHGDWSSEAILNATKTYSYDAADRLTSVQDTFNTQCTIRNYAYDADSNRTSRTTYAAGANGACQTSSGTTTSSAYDSADRATNTGYTFDTQGDITSTPSADAGGTGSLTATYYANNMLASQAQNGATMTWTLDPTQGRFSSCTRSGVTYTSHYSDAGNIPAWGAGSDGSWTRSVSGFNGILAAQVNVSGTTLELSDLHGDIVATASTSATATGPATTYTYTEFGTPETGSPGAYGWLGGDQISNNALGGQLLMGARAYNANTGRFSQTDPVPGGSANPYDYAQQNPVTNFDLTGKWWVNGEEVHTLSYCNGTGTFGLCIWILDYWASWRLVRSLFWAGVFGAGCQNAVGGIPVIGRYLSLLCQIFGGLASHFATALINVWRICGINTSTGLWFFGGAWRYGWWWFGWHWSVWYPWQITFVGCW